ncbi:GNAT family N-acetyltransferase [Chloroflexota bacterium]
MLLIRPEIPENEAAIRHVNEEAFDGIVEASLVEGLRSRQAIILSLVAIDGDKVVGHILFSPVIIESESQSFDAAGLGPMAVLPLYQRKGVGSELVRAGLEECRRLGHEIVVILGHPEYYPRFGFVPAMPKGIGCEFEVPEEAWMILELHEGALGGRRGKVRFQPEFKEAV